MFLSDGDILKKLRSKELVIKPFREEQLLPDGYALRMDRKVRFVRIGDITHVDVKAKRHLTEMIDVGKEGFVIVRPGELVLASTVEKIKLGREVAALIQGRTSLSRIGLQVDTSAGMVSPGFEGKLTITLHNVFELPIKIYVGMRIVELVFVQMSSPVKQEYGYGRFSGRYQRQMEPKESRIWEDFEEDQ